MEASNDFFNELKQRARCEVRTDLTTRILYSTDASMYSIEPLGVAFPQGVDEVQAIVELAAKYQVPLIARGSGSGLAGQAIGRGLILDFSRHLNRIIQINPEERTAVVEAGAILDTLNREAGRYGLTFGPDPASAERASIGGCIANNATGAHSILYGMTADHLVEAEVILADGSPATFHSTRLEEAERRALSGASGGVEGALYRTALDIRGNHAEAIRRGWPQVWRRTAGYNLNYLLPWSPSGPPGWETIESQAGTNYPPVLPGEINLAALIAGSEGTLGLLHRATLRLVPKPRFTIMGLLAFDSIAEACDAAPFLLSQSPAAVELIPGDLIRLARSIPAYAQQLDFFHWENEAMLVVEYLGDDIAYLEDRLARLGKQCRSTLNRNLIIVENPDHQRQVWNVRKVGLGFFLSQPGDERSVAFIEDVAVPVDRLGEYVRGLERIFAHYEIDAHYYAHASAGCLHVRPAINLKTREGIGVMRSVAAEVFQFAAQLGGVVSGEHGDGLARSEWMNLNFPAEIIRLFERVKRSADLDGLLNPGKIVNPEPMDINQRYGADYIARAWEPVFDYTRKGGLVNAIELCNGAGVCRKDGGVMCPSFQATREEMHSTRGRANLLRALTVGRFPSKDMEDAAVYQALDLCLACKGCKSECPSAVDVANLKYEFINDYYRTHRRKVRDYLFGYIGLLAPLGYAFAPVLNAVKEVQGIKSLGERFLGLASRRSTPEFSNPWGRRARGPQLRTSAPRGSVNAHFGEQVLFLSDAFTHYFDREVEEACQQALARAGVRARIIPVLGAGRTLISKGFLGPARNHALRLLQALRKMDPQGVLPVVGAEPSEIYTLRDEFMDFFPKDEWVNSLSNRAWMVDEFLLRPGEDGQPYINRLRELSTPGEHKKVLLHGHCYQKAQPLADDGFPSGVNASILMLQEAGYQVELIDSGCCGMAGAFGYEVEHYDVSMKVGELALFPALRKADPSVIVATAGTSCRSQIKDGTGRRAMHPICLV